MNNATPNEPACGGPGHAKLEDSVSRHEAPTVDVPQGHQTTSPEYRDEVVGEQLDLHLQILRAGGQPPAAKPGFESDLDQLRPVVDQLHALSDFLDAGAHADSTQDRRETIQTKDRP